MQIEIGKMVLISDRYNGMVWEVVESQVDEFGEFVTVDQDGESQCRHIDDVDQVR